MISAARVGEQSDVEWKLVYRRPALANSIHVGGGNHAAEGARRAETLVVGHDQEDVRSFLGGTMRGGHQGVD